MRRLLFLAILLAAASLACGQAPAVAVAAPAEAPAPATPAFVEQVIKFVSAQGMTFLGYDSYGQLECGNDYCVHFNYGSGPAGTSLYIENDKLASTLVVFPTNSPAATTRALAETEVAVEMKFWPPMTQAEMDCIVEQDLGVSAQCGRFFTASQLADGLIYVSVMYTSYTTHTSIGGSL